MRHVSDRGATRNATAAVPNVSDNVTSTTDFLLRCACGGMYHPGVPGVQEMSDPRTLQEPRQIGAVLLASINSKNTHVIIDLSTEYAFGGSASMTGFNNGSGLIFPHVGSTR